MHNQIFPDTAYCFHGFAGFDGRTVQPVIRQPRVADAHPATMVMIETYMAALGFEKTTNEGHFTNGRYESVSCGKVLAKASGRAERRNVPQKSPRQGRKAFTDGAGLNPG